MKLEEKTAIVTGGGSGIGRETAIRFAEKGSKVLVVSRNEAKLEETCNEIAERGGIAAYCAADVSDRDQVNNAIDFCLRNFGNIDILVNSAGIFEEAAFVNDDREILTRSLNVNLLGVWECCQAVIKHMMQQNIGSIVNITSSDAFTGCVNYSHYAMAKAGVIGLSRSLALECGEYGIRVNCVAPGITQTDMTAGRISEKYSQYIEGSPLRQIGKPEDVANAVLFLASDMAANITGQVIHVNGGSVFF